jgi:hypothetical protein
MPTLNRIVVMLEEQRRQLLDQLAAVDKAIAALSSAEQVAPEEDVATPVVPRRVKSKRVLTDEHKEALNAGRRKARTAREAAKGLAREMPDEGFVPAIGTRRDNHVPRLVKHPHKT